LEKKMILTLEQIEQLKNAMEAKLCRCKGTGKYLHSCSDVHCETEVFECSQHPAPIKIADKDKTIMDLIATVLYYQEELEKLIIGVS
jgi:hypothetical protein